MAKNKVKTKTKTKILKSKALFLKYIVWVLAIISLILFSLMTGYYFGYEKAHSQILKAQKLESQKRVSAISKIEKSLKKEHHKSVNKKLQEVLKKEVKEKYISASHEFDTKEIKKVLIPPIRPFKLTTRKPRLAIIIDDVGSLSQVKAIDSLNLRLTKSFLPPSKSRPNSAKLAKKEKFYMVHLPMEAMHFSAEEPNTLRVKDSQQVISARIREIRRLFPKVHYINNHTGSKFTSNEIAMNRLISALNDNKISFVDSRTTAKTKAPMVLKNFGQKYVARDVFLDHHMDKAYVKSQIKNAIRIAKSHGTAIAIGHPHPNTLQALRESKQLLKEVDLVYINKIY